MPGKNQSPYTWSFLVLRPHTFLMCLTFWILLTCSEYIQNDLGWSIGYCIAYWIAYWIAHSLGGGTRVVGGRGGGAGGLGKLPTVRQAKDHSRASQGQPGAKGSLSGKAKTVRQAPNRSIDLHLTSAYFAPHRFRIHAPKCFIDMHP
jgi:hypothetical protein